MPLSNEHPIISILMPVFRRETLLRWGLYSLSLQKCKYPFEVLVLNDGIEDRTEQICKEFDSKLNIRYIFTGQRNEKMDKITWRVPGFPINIGAKLAKGKVLIITCPEIYHLEEDAIEQIVTPTLENSMVIGVAKGFDDQANIFADYLNKGLSRSVESVSNLKMEKLNTKLPFFMPIDKKIFLTIGGYDEEMTGICFDDNDLIDRLGVHHIRYKEINTNIVHLYHPRGHYKGEDYGPRFRFNQEMYLNRKGKIVRNEGKDWGKIEPSIYNTAETEWHLPKIPKIAHFYWGNEKLPYMRYMALFSFYKLNPDWEIRLYVPKQKYADRIIDCHGKKTEYNGEDYFPQLKLLPISIIEEEFKFLLNLNVEQQSANESSRKEVYKSDFLRWHLLSTVGGLWSDIDIIYFKSITNLDLNRTENKELDTIISLHPSYGHSVGFMLGSANNLYYKYIFSLAEQKFNPKAYQSIGVDLLNGPFPTSEAIMKKFPKLTVKGTSVKTVYAYDAFLIDKIYNSSSMARFNEDSIGLHWYAGHPLAIKHQGFLNHLNCHTFDNVIGKVISKVYKTVQNNFKIIIPVYNADKWIKQCIDSIKTQTYKNFEAVIINDCSKDQTKTIIEQEIREDSRFKFINNETKSCALENTVKGINHICKDDEDIIVIVDGDDWLPTNDVFDYLNSAYQDETWTTWGNFKLASTNKACTFKKEDGTKVPWADELREPFDRTKTGRFLFSHIRTYKYFLFKKIKDKDLKDENGKYYTTAGDALVAFPIIEMAGAKHRKNIQKIMYCYNDLNQLNDMKICREKQLQIYDDLRYKMKPYEELDTSRNTYKIQLPLSKNKIDCLIWSKDRAMQLDLLLRSIRKMFPEIHKVWVRWDTSSGTFKKGYNKLRKKKYGLEIEYVHEKTLEEDTKDILRKINNDEVQYMFCCVDDGAFIRPIQDIDALIDCFDDNVTAVSLRMSDKITHCYGSKTESPLPEFVYCKYNFLKWDWTKCNPITDWGYPGAIDSQIYRTQWFKDVFLNCNYNLPTNMETYLQEHKNELFKPYLVSDRQTYLLNFPMNRVQTEWLNNPHGEISPMELNQKFLEGYVIDTTNIYNCESNAVNKEVEFKFIREK